MPAAVKSAVLRSPFLWMGVLLLVALIGALVFSDGVAELARFSADYQRRIQQSLSTSLRDIKSGSGSLVAVCFGYGVVHTLGPGHGKAVVVAYFLDSKRPRAWIEGVFAGSWIAFTHTLAALLLAGGLKTFAVVGLFGALREVRNVEIVSYTLILLIGFWRLWAGISARVPAGTQFPGLYAFCMNTPMVATIITTITIIITSIRRSARLRDGCC